jgi:hypothetical protein
MARPTRAPVPSRTHLDLLTGPAAGEVLQVALQGHGQVLSWRANQVDYQPRRGSTAGYRVRVRWPDGRVNDEWFGAFTGEPPPGAVVVADGEDQVSVWRVPHDPYLPGLAAAYDRVAVAGLMAGFELGGGPVRLLLRAYRPRRRAVVEAVGPGGRLFLKVVRPDLVESLHERHRLLTGAGVPVAPSLGYTPAGLLVLPHLPGQSLRQVLQERSAVAPPPAAILDLLDRLPAELVAAPRRRSLLRRMDHFAAVIAASLPEEAERSVQLAAAIAAVAGTGPTVAVHGDFYESQLRVQAGRLTGLLDLDTAGPGDRLDDLACLLGHLSVLTPIYPDRAAAISGLGARYLAAFDRTVDPVDLRYRVAAVVLSLATGPYRVQETGWRRATRGRLDLVERWLDSARTLAGGGHRTAGEAGVRPLAAGSEDRFTIEVAAGGSGPADLARSTEERSGSQCASTGPGG